MNRFGKTCEVCDEPVAEGSYPVFYCREHASQCDFCKGRPVGNATTWLDDVRRPPLACPRCGVLTRA